MSFTQPWILLSLPLPLLVRWILSPASIAQAWALRAPFAADRTVDDASRRWFGGASKLYPWLIWLLILTAAADPIRFGPASERPTTGRDLFLVIDISGSMNTADFGTDKKPLTRLEAVKDVASTFIADRGGDRIGLILFGDLPFLVAPPTFDRKAIGRMLGEATVELGGNATAIGDAVGLALKHMRELQAESSVAVILTDGANNAGAISPLQAAHLARRAGIKLYAIGLGAPRSAVPDPRAAWSESRSDPGRDLLRDMATATEGTYFHALDREGLQRVYDRLDRLEPSLGPDARVAGAEHLYPWLLGAALLLSFLAAAHHWRSGEREAQA